MEIFYVAQRRCAKLAAVFAAELGGAFVSHLKSGAGRVQMLHQHESAGLVQSHPFLVLQGAHAGHGAKMVVKGRRAHAYLPCKAVDLEGLDKVVLESVNGSGYLKTMTAG